MTVHQILKINKLNKNIYFKALPSILMISGVQLDLKKNIYTGQKVASWWWGIWGVLLHGLGTLIRWISEPCRLLQFSTPNINVEGLFLDFFSFTLPT